VDRLGNGTYVVNGVVTARKSNRPALIVYVQVFGLVRLSVICGHVWRIYAKARNGHFVVCFVFNASNTTKPVPFSKLRLL